jgi:hypothetical protein
MEKRQRKQRNRKQHLDQIRGVRSNGDKDNTSQAQTKAKEWLGLGKPKKTLKLKHNQGGFNNPKTRD